MISGKLIPSSRLRIILRHFPAFEVHVADLYLSVRVASVGSTISMPRKRYG